MTYDGFVLDAHTLVWYLEDSPRLGAGAGTVLDDPQSALFLPVIALAEACWIAEHGRSKVPNAQAVLSRVDADPRITIVPLDRRILDMANTLVAVGEVHDRMIVATTQLLGPATALLTRDRNIAASGLVPAVW